MSINPLDHNNLRGRIESTLSDFVDARRPMLDAISPDVSVLANSLATLISGGKRLRPAFAYWGFRATGGEDSDALVRACAGLEFLQACALIHDDVMDSSDTRRGNPSTHKQFQAFHEQGHWRGDGLKFGEGAAILIGDLALSWADELLLTSGLAADATTRAKTVYDVMRTELMAGQYLDLLEQVRGNTTVERASNVIRFKSAKYTIERPLLIGAAIGDAPTELNGALSAYGLALGEAFQLRDDVLGVFGDHKTTGKPTGDDLREGKETVLIAYGRTMGDDQLRTLLAEQLGNPSITAEHISDISTRLDACGALGAVEKRIDEMTSAAHEALAHPLVDTEAREALTELVHIATQRAF